MIKAALGSTAFFFAAPCVVAGLIPRSITHWHNPQFWPALVLVALGTLIVLRAFTRFVREGRGTPAPIAPTQQLVIGGDYRYVRNPMYVGVVLAILAQSLLFLSLPLLLYGLFAWAVMASFVHWYEEPLLRKQYGPQYDTYCQAVPAWLPRIKP
jgi:protein-S-isoprenylcysteine O-methyltransferase Ste14